jgi:hypothetical protein
LKSGDAVAAFLRKFIGSSEFIDGTERFCLWVDEDDVEDLRSSHVFEERMKIVSNFRASSAKESTRDLAGTPYLFSERRHHPDCQIIVIPKVSSESRGFLPAGVLEPNSIVSDNAFAIYDSELWSLSLVTSKLHFAWVSTVCGQLETRIRYSNTLGWNTFPIPPLTQRNKADLSRCAENILLAREAHFPATIADLYDPDNMPENLRHAHERNDEVLERIYVGRRFKNDTERLEKLFELYTKMTAKQTVPVESKKVEPKKEVAK